MAEHGHDHVGHFWARPGDRLVIRARSLGQPNRDAEILEALGEGDAPPFRVRWQDDGHISEIFPGSDAYVEHLARTESADQVELSDR
jgi:Domain of unknown function (DUF1918)